MHALFAARVAWRIHSLLPIEEQQIGDALRPLLEFGHRVERPADRAVHIGYEHHTQLPLGKRARIAQDVRKHALGLSRFARLERAAYQRLRNTVLQVDAGGDLRRVAAQNRVDVGKVAHVIEKSLQLDTGSGADARLQCIEKERGRVCEFGQGSMRVLP